MTSNIKKSPPKPWAIPRLSSELNRQFHVTESGNISWRKCHSINDLCCRKSSKKSDSDTLHTGTNITYHIIHLVKRNIIIIDSKVLLVKNILVSQECFPCSAVATMSCCCISATKFMDEIQCWALPHLVAEDLDHWPTAIRRFAAHVRQARTDGRVVTAAITQALQNTTNRTWCLVQSSYQSTETVSGYPNQSYLSCFKQKNTIPAASNNFNACLGWEIHIEFITQITCSSRKTTTSKQVGTINEKSLRDLFFSRNFRLLQVGWKMSDPSSPE